MQTILSAYSKLSVSEYFPLEIINKKHSIRNLQRFIQYRFLNHLDNIINQGSKVYIISSGNHLKILNTFELAGFIIHTEPLINYYEFSLYQMSFMQTSETIYVILILPGESFISHILGYLLMYRNNANKQINYQNIEIYKDKEITDYEYFNNLLTQNTIEDIDIAVFLNFVDFQLTNKFASVDKVSFNFDNTRVGSYLSVCNNFNNRKCNILILCPVFPYFFSDRVAYLVPYLKTKKCRNIIFCATAGGIGDIVNIGDIILPQKFILNEKQIEIENYLYSSLNQNTITQFKLKKTSKHISLQTMFFETNEYINNLYFRDIYTIDCELSYIAEALSNDNDIKLSALLSISDKPNILSSDFIEIKESINKINKPIQISIINELLSKITDSQI